MPRIVPRVVIVACSSSEMEVRRVLSKFLPSKWSLLGYVKLIIRPDNLRRFAKETKEVIDRVADAQDGARIVFVGRIECLDSFGKGVDLRVANRFNDIRSFEKGVSSIFKQSGVDWRTSTLHTISLWQHGVISEESLNAWLDQFAKLGCPWVGEYLLREIDFWPPERLRLAIGLDKIVTLNDDVICLKRKEVGKSGDFLAGIFKKQLRNKSLKNEFHDFEEYIHQKTGVDAEPERIHLVEDCLLTGTEMENFISGLLGVNIPQGRTLKVKPLNDQRFLRRSKIELRFAVGTSLGRRRLEEFLIRNDLRNITISIAEEGYYEVLTTEGEQAFDKGCFYNSNVRNCPADSDRYIEKIAFRGAWNKESMRLAAQDFCKKVGTQIYEEFLKEKGWTWPAIKIDAAGLGMHGLALTVAFSHSIPKASLPLFWGGGRVSYKGAKAEWNPLFEGAAF